MTVALFLSMELFHFTPSAWAQAHDFKVQGGDPSKDLSLLVRDAKIRIPPELGFVEESFHGTSGKTMVYLQDAHDSLEAQENIAKIVHHLVSNYGVKEVFEEGYEGPVPTDKYFGFIKDPGVKEKVSYFLMDHLRVGGAEYAHINRTKDFNLVGADSLKLHKENIEQYRLSAAKKEAITKDLRTLSRELKSLVASRFPKELKEWIKTKERFDAKELDLAAYLGRTMPLLGERGTEKGLGLIRFLVAAMKTKDPVVIEKAKHMDAREVFGELIKLEDAVAETYLHDAVNKQLFKDYKILSILNRLNELQVSQEEYEAVKASLKTFDTESFAKFIFRQAPRTLILSRIWERNIKDAVWFYEIAQERDHALSQRLDENSEGGNKKEAWARPSDILNPPVSVLVFGGFHKEAIKRILEAKGISYLVVSPHITQPSPRHEAFYKCLMANGRLSYELPANLHAASRPETQFEIWKDHPSSAGPELRTMVSVAALMPQVDTPSLILAMEQALKVSGDRPSARSEMRGDQAIIQELTAVNEDWDQSKNIETLDKKRKKFNLMRLHGQLLVNGQGEGVLIFGKEGVGKSSLSIQILEQFKTFGYLADDWILLTVIDGKIYAGVFPPMDYPVIDYRPQGVPWNSLKGKVYPVAQEQLRKGFVRVGTILLLSSKPIDHPTAEKKETTPDVITALFHHYQWPEDRKLDLKTPSDVNPQHFGLWEICLPSLKDRFKDIRPVLHGIFRSEVRGNPADGGQRSDDSPYPNTAPYEFDPQGRSRSIREAQWTETRNADLESLVPQLLVNGKAPSFFYINGQDPSARRVAFESQMALFRLFQAAPGPDAKDRLAQAAGGIARRLDHVPDGPFTQTVQKIARAYWREWHRTTTYEELNMIKRYRTLVGQSISIKHTWTNSGAYPLSEALRRESLREQRGMNHQIILVLKMPSFLSTRDTDQSYDTALPHIGDEILPEGFLADETILWRLRDSYQFWEAQHNLTRYPLADLDIEASQRLSDMLMVAHRADETTRSAVNQNFETLKTVNPGAGLAPHQGEGQPLSPAQAENRSEVRQNPHLSVAQRVDQLIAETPRETDRLLDRNAWTNDRTVYGLGEKRELIRDIVREVFNAALEMRIQGPAPKIVDVGAGTGWLPTILDERWKKGYVPFDKNPNYLRQAIQAGRATTSLEGDAEKFASYVHDADAVIGTDSFDTFENLPLVMSQIYQGLKPGGKFIAMQMLNADARCILRGANAEKFKASGMVYSPHLFRFFRNEHDLRTALRAYVEFQQSGDVNLLGAANLRFGKTVRELEVPLNLELFKPHMREALEGAGFEDVKVWVVQAQNELPLEERHRKALPLIGQKDASGRVVNGVFYKHGNVMPLSVPGLQAGHFFEQAEFLLFYAQKPMLPPAPTAVRSEARTLQKNVLTSLLVGAVFAMAGIVGLLNWRVFGILIATDQAGFHLHPPPDAPLRFLSLPLVVYLSFLPVHEIGHFLTARLLREPARIVITLLGPQAEWSRKSAGPWRAAWIEEGGTFGYMGAAMLSPAIALWLQPHGSWQGFLAIHLFFVSAISLSGFIVNQFTTFLGREGKLFGLRDALLARLHGEKNDGKDQRSEVRNAPGAFPSVNAHLLSRTPIHSVIKEKNDAVPPPAPEVARRAEMREDASSTSDAVQPLRMWGKEIYVVTGKHGEPRMKTQVLQTLHEKIPAPYEDVLFLVEGDNTIYPEVQAAVLFAAKQNIPVEDPILDHLNPAVVNQYVREHPEETYLGVYTRYAAVKHLVYGGTFEETVKDLSLTSGIEPHQLVGSLRAFSEKIQKDAAFREAFGKRGETDQQAVIPIANALSFQLTQEILKRYPEKRRIFVLIGAQHRPIFDIQEPPPSAPLSPEALQRAVQTRERFKAYREKQKIENAIEGVLQIFRQVFGDYFKVFFSASAIRAPLLKLLGMEAEDAMLVQAQAMIRKDPKGGAALPREKIASNVVRLVRQIQARYPDLRYMATHRMFSRSEIRDGRVDVNTADREVLIRVFKPFSKNPEGIANQILDRRSEQLFRSTEDLVARVRGIGRATALQAASRLEFSGIPAAARKPDIRILGSSAIVNDGTYSVEARLKTGEITTVNINQLPPQAVADEHQPMGQVAGHFLGNGKTVVYGERQVTEAVRDFLLKDELYTLKTILKTALGREVQTEEILSPVDLVIAKFGSFEHIFQLIVRLTTSQAPVFIALHAPRDASSEKVLQADAVIQDRLGKIHPGYLPRAYGLGQGKSRGGTTLWISANEWKMGFLELHLSTQENGSQFIAWKKEDENILVRDPEVQKKISRQIFKILTLYNEIDPLFVKVNAGDFVVNFSNPAEPLVNIISTRNLNSHKGPVLFYDAATNHVLVHNAFLFLAFLLTFRVQNDPKSADPSKTFKDDRGIWYTRDLIRFADYHTVLEGFYEGVKERLLADGLPEEDLEETAAETVEAILDGFLENYDSIPPRASDTDTEEELKENKTEICQAVAEYLKTLQTRDGTRPQARSEIRAMPVVLETPATARPAQASPFTETTEERRLPRLEAPTGPGSQRTLSATLPPGAAAAGPRLAAAGPKTTGTAPWQIRRLPQDVIAVLKQSRIDALSPEMFKELLELVWTNNPRHFPEEGKTGEKSKLHLFIPDTDVLHAGERVRELAEAGAVHYNASELPDASKIPILGFADMERSLEDFQKGLAPWLVQRMRDSVFGLNRPGDFGVGILYALKDIPPDQLPPNKNGFRYDAARRYAAQVLEVLQAYTVISVSA